MAWAAGAAFPMFRAACKDATAAAASGDLQRAADAWKREAVQSHLDDSHNSGLTPGNQADNTLFTNAGQVVLQGLDPDVLQFPTAL